jgi:hypothetical protein
MRSALIAPGRDFFDEPWKESPLGGVYCWEGTHPADAADLGHEAPDGMTADIRTKPGVRP